MLENIPSEYIEEKKLEETLIEKVSIQKAEKKKSLMVVEEEIKTVDEEKIIRFNEEENIELLDNIHYTSKEKQLKLSNPIRDYCHLLSNRLVLLIIDLEQSMDEANRYLQGMKQLKSLVMIKRHIQYLRTARNEVVRHVNSQLRQQS